MISAKAVSEFYQTPIASLRVNGFPFHGYLIEITPPPDFIAGFGFDGFAVDRWVVFHAAAEASGLSEREDVFAVLIPAVFPAEFHNPHPYSLTESGEARIGRRWRVSVF